MSLINQERSTYKSEHDDVWDDESQNPEVHLSVMTVSVEITFVNTIHHVACEPELN
jgi:hypothetical protein